MRLLNLLLAALIAFASPISASIAAAAPATPAASASSTSTSDLYRDPDGRFTIPIPTNWTAERHGPRVILNDPEGDFSVVALVVTAETAEAGLAQAVAEVDPALAAVQAPATTPPSATGIDETVVITYDSGRQSGTLAQGYAQRVGTTVYVLIFRGSVDAAVKRNSQVQVIGSGFTIAGVATVDLSKQRALPLDGALLSTFDAYVAALLPRLSVPGASVAVVQNGKVVFAQGYGVKTLGGADPVTPDTRHPTPG